jgi:hypothetical protein
MEEMIEVIGKTPEGKSCIKINRFFALEELNKIGILCAYKNELTQSFLEGIVSKNSSNGIQIEETTIKIGGKKYVALIAEKETKNQLIEATEEFDLMLRQEIMRKPNVPKNVQ